MGLDYIISKEDIKEKYSKKSKSMREDYALCPHPNCDGYGMCLCCKNTEGCLSLAKEYETIVSLISTI